MIDPVLGTLAVLGSSSARSRLDVVNTETGEVRTIAEHPPGNGIYGISRYGQGLAYGTRGGITRYTQRFHDPGAGPILWNTLSLQGPQKLSVCLTPDYLAESDTAGVHLWYDLDGPKPHSVALDTHGQMICALAPRDEFLTGLSANGGIRIWRTTDGTLVDVVESPAPPERCALVNLVPCFGIAVSYPTESGHVATYVHSTRRVEICPAHEGKCYAASALPDGLLTIGLSDGLVLLRDKRAGKPSTILHGPQDIIAGAAFAGITLTILFIDSRGATYVCRREGEALRLVRELPQKDYRSVAGPSPAELDAATARLKTDAIRRIARDLESRGASLPPEEAYELHGRLITLGAEPVSLEIYAQQAQKNQANEPMERLVELELRVRQAELLKCKLEAKDPRVLRPLLRRLDLLEELHQWGEALRLAEQLAAVNSNAVADHEMERLRDYAEAARAGKAVIELGDELPFDIIVGAANLLGQPVRGLFAVAFFSPIASGDVADRPDLVLDKYAWGRSQGANRFPGMPDLTLHEVWWLNASGGYRCETLFAGENTGLNGPHWVFACPLRPLSSGPLPVLALDTGPGPGAAPTVAESSAHNARVLDVHRRIDTEGKTAAWSRRTYRAVCEAVTAAACEIEASVLRATGARR